MLAAHRRISGPHIRPCLVTYQRVDSICLGLAVETRQVDGLSFPLAPAFRTPNEDSFLAGSDLLRPHLPCMRKPCPKVSTSKLSKLRSPDK